MRLSLNGKDCESITPQPSSTASVNKRASIGRDGEGMRAYLDSLKREEQNRINNEAYDKGAETPSEDESDWSEDEGVTQADRDAADWALGRVKRGSKRRRKRRRKTRRKKKRKSRRKSRKRKRKRKTKRRR